ncbi:transmembrane and coiled-coil domain-containing protein 6 isoform 2-T2 [Alca torda]
MWGRPRRGAGPGGGQSAEELRARRREREAALRKARRQEQLVSKRLLREDIAEEGGQDGAESVPGPLSEDEELCLYTLGNLVVESEAVRKQLLPQGIIPVLASCIQSPHEAVLEGLGYILSQLLQAKEAPTEIVPLVLDSVLPQHMLRMVCSGLKAGTGAAVEFAWCLHYIVCSHTANAVLLSLGALPALTSLLLDMASEIPQGAPEGLELLVCPVLRCLSNLLAEETGCEGQIQDERLLIALFLILQSFFQQHPFIVQECLWLLNNLTGECPTAMSPELLLGPASIAGRSWLHRPLSETMILSMVPALADDPFFCSALLSLDLLPALLQLLPCSQMAGVLVLTVLCNVAEKGPTYCQQLHHQPALPLLLPTLALPDPEVVGQCLELLHLLFLHCPEVRAGDACPTIKPKVIKAGMGIIITIEMILPSAIATPAPVLSTQTHACLKGDTL